MNQALFPLKERREVAKETMEFIFDTSKSNFSYEAGQYCDFTLINPPTTDDEGNTRAFSLVSSPNDKGIVAITTRMRHSAFKNNLKAMSLGTEVKVTGPIGNFTLPENTKQPLVFLAGGIGITPMHSMIAWATEEKTEHKIQLFYSNHSLDQAPFLDDVKTWQDQNTHFMPIVVLTDDDHADGNFVHQRIDINLIKQYVADITLPKYYTSGPDSFVSAMKALLTENGVSKDNVLAEEFAGY